MISFLPLENRGKYFLVDALKILKGLTQKKIKTWALCLILFILKTLKTIIRERLHSSNTNSHTEPHTQPQPTLSLTQPVTHTNTLTRPEPQSRSVAHPSVSRTCWYHSRLLGCRFGRFEHCFFLFHNSSLLWSFSFIVQQTVRAVRTVRQTLGQFRNGRNGLRSK